MAGSWLRVVRNQDISWPGGGGPKYEVLHPATGKPVAIPSRGWMTSDPEKMKLWINDDRVHFGEDETSVPCIKSYLKDRELQTPYSVFYQDGRAASKRLRALMGSDCFDFPKDEAILQEIIEMMTSGNDVVMDFFAGSGTTAHAVIAQNAQDSGDRRFILVQLPELLDAENKDQKAAAEFCDELGKPKNIAELTKERIRRAAAAIKKENPKFAGDIGFRVFKLATSNIGTWDPDRADIAASLDQAVEHLKADRSEQDILSELLLKLGLDLTTPIDKKAISGKTVYSIGAGVLMVCLDTKIAATEVEKLAHGIADWHKALATAGETTIVFRDSAFANDVAKTNLTAILQQHGLDNVRSL